MMEANSCRQFDYLINICQTLFLHQTMAAVAWEQNWATTLGPGEMKAGSGATTIISMVPKTVNDIAAIPEEPYQRLQLQFLP
jgi:hypothetical protein